METPQSPLFSRASFRLRLVTLAIAAQSENCRDSSCLRVLTRQSEAIDTTTAAGKLVCGIFAALAEFERELIRERTIAGLASARACKRKGGRGSKLRLAQAAIGEKGHIRS
jgi:hypothetical protein